MNREKFLKNITSNIGRPMPTVVERKWQFRPQDKTLTDLSQDELVEVLKEHCKAIHTEVYEITTNEMNDTIQSIIDKSEDGDIIAWNDERFKTMGLDLQAINAFIWDEEKQQENFEVAERASIGITMSDVTLAESATVVLYTDHGKGRSVSLLPKNYIAIIPKSTIVPRFTQAAQQMNALKETGDFPSCINLISGPSNSADIELNLVVGVHGPVTASYIIVNDQ